VLRADTPELEQNLLEPSRGRAVLLMTAEEDDFTSPPSSDIRPPAPPEASSDPRRGSAPHRRSSLLASLPGTPRRVLKTLVQTATFPPTADLVVFSGSKEPYSTLASSVSGTTAGH